MDPDPHPHLAMRTTNRRFAGYGEPQVRLVTREDCFLKCDELSAFQACTADGQIPFGGIAEIVGDGHLLNRFCHPVLLVEGRNTII